MERMTRKFSDALAWHLAEHGNTLAELSRGAGVSLDILKKLNSRPGSSTKAGTAMKIAAFYGKSVEQFLSCGEVSQRERVAAALDLLEEDELRLLYAQIHGIVASRDR